MRTVIAKFGGTSLADAGQFRKVKAIIEQDPARRVIVASAPGKRFPEDIKVTDLLLACYEQAQRGEPFEETLGKIRERFDEILTDGRMCLLHIPRASARRTEDADDIDQIRNIVPFFFDKSH